MVDCRMSREELTEEMRDILDETAPFLHQRRGGSQREGLSERGF